jgi:hypothetical protein
MKRVLCIAVLMMFFPCALLLGETIGNDMWGFTFAVPEGWLYQQGPDGAVLGHNSIPGMIIVMPHMTQNVQEVLGEMRQGLVEEGVQLYPAGDLRKIDSGIIAGDYQGLFNGQRVKATVIGTVSSEGGGAYIFALALPQEFNDELGSAAMSIAQNMHYVKSDSGSLMAHFAGSWASFSSNTEDYITFFANGTYTNEYVASYSGEFTDAFSGEQTGNWGVAGGDQELGTWTIRGNRKSGMIILKSSDGSTYEINYQVHVENGVTYWSEYYFNGSFYMKNTE